MNLTKEQAIKEHRKMWNWIADEYEKGRQEGVAGLKAEYLYKNFPDEDISCMCFCCEYCNTKCDKCPLQWLDYRTGEKKQMCLGNGKSTGLYEQISYVSKLFVYKNKINTKECAEIARMIANLEEK